VVDSLNRCIRIMSADLQEVRTLCTPCTLGITDAELCTAIAVLPNGNVLMASEHCIHVLAGFASAAWLRRRTLLLSLVAAQLALRCVHKRAAPAHPLPSCVLKRVAALPTELWPSLFQYI